MWQQRLILFVLLLPLSWAMRLETTIDLVNATDPTDDTDAVLTTLSPFLPTNAEKLVRYRRHPPVTIVKHIFRSSKRSKPRIRYKKPKIKYAPSSYTYGEPLTYYKTHSSSYEKPTYSIDEFQHMNIDAADFDLPHSSYETQAMELDFYSPDDSSYGHAPKTPHIEYSFDIEQEAPSYSSYAPQRPSKHQTVVHVPHQTYGVPEDYETPSYKYKSHDSPSYSTAGEHYHAPMHRYKAHYSSSYASAGGKYQEATDDEDYSKPSSSYSSDTDSYNLHSTDHYQPEHVPEQEYSPPYDEHVSHNPSSEYGAPSTKVADSYAPPAVYTDYQLPEIDYHQSFSKHAQKHRNGGRGANTKHQHFAEPPAHNADIEIAYAPSYEIKLPSSKHAKPFNNYDHAVPSQVGDFAEPPEHEHVPASPPQYPAPDYGAPTHTGLNEDYVPPPVHDLPLNTEHMHPHYDSPKSSYEVPIYDPIPFEASNNEGQEQYPPHIQDTASKEQTQGADSTIVQYSTENQNHNAHVPSTGFAIVPLEDDTSHSYTPSTTTTSENAARPRRTRKRKRVHGSTTTSSTRYTHILDAPELEEAFQADKQHNYGEDADAHASFKVEEKQRFPNNYYAHSTDSENYISSAWNPMRIRTTSIIGSTPTTLNTLANDRPSTPSIKYRKRLVFKPRTQQSYTKVQRENTTISPKLAPSTAYTRDAQNVALFSIEKSRSQSYYDGTVVPPTSSTTTKQRNRFNKFKAYTRTTPTTVTPTSMQEPFTPSYTTANVFETTYFKSPHTDSEREREQVLSLLVQNLPKNHKLF